MKRPVLYVNGVIFNDVTSDSTYATAVMFASHFAINLQYNAKCVAVMEYYGT